MDDKDSCSTLREQDFVYIHDFKLQGSYERNLIGLGTIIAQDYDPEISRRLDGTVFRWIQIPENDTDTVEKCVKSLAGEREAHLLRKTWLHKVRPTQSSIALIAPPHARHMEPSFQANTLDQNNVNDEPVGEPSYAIFLPYLNWNTFADIMYDESSTHTESRHLRRTLAQYYYKGLRDTTYKDAGQTVSKWTGQKLGLNGRTEAAADSLVAIVDQLWIWILPGPTLVSCFPMDANIVGGYSGSETFEDVMASVGTNLQECKDVYDLLALLVLHAVTNVFNEQNTRFADLLGIYRWAIANKAARYTEHVEKFVRRQIPNLEQTAAGITDCLGLTLEVVNILDELDILLLLLNEQDDVINLLRENLSRIKPISKGSKTRVSNVPANETNVRSESGLYIREAKYGSLGQQGAACIGTDTIDGCAGRSIKLARQTSMTVRADVERLRNDAGQTYKKLVELLDLKQKDASRAEAHAALAEARSTTMQGRAIMLFTAVTIVFLPLSFFTSYFGQNVSDITGDEKNPTAAELWKVAGPISVAVIFTAVLVTYLIYRNKKTRHGRV